MAKLTLSIDEGVVARAKRVAKRQGTSVSAMVEAYLDGVSRGAEKGAPAATPVLHSIRGLLKKGDREDYRQHVSAKHR